MKMLMGFVLGMIVATAGLSWSQSWRPGDMSPQAQEGRDWQNIWQQQQLDESRRFEHLSDPCVPK